MAVCIGPRTSLEGGRADETDISTEPPSPEQNTRLPVSNAHSRRAAGAAPETV